jgi:DNA-3-methyladenine glycosylase I
MPAMERPSKKQPVPAAPRRCPWCESTALYRAYHDREWGVPVHADRRWFEMLVLDGAQAGLSWRTILEKRQGYRRAFDRFDPRKVARYDARRIRALLADPGIVRNRQKVRSAVVNARAFLAVQREFGSFDRFIWSFTAGRTVQNRWRSDRQIPPRTPLSDAVSAELKRRGFSFVGTTIVYALLQAAGVVNDHLTGCFRHRELAALARARRRPAPARPATGARAATVRGGGRAAATRSRRPAATPARPRIARGG